MSITFDGIEFHKVTVPFISTVEKAERTVLRINQAAEIDGRRPIVFSTLVRDEIRSVVRRSEGLFLDFFDAFLAPLEKEFELPSAESTGRAHGIADSSRHTHRSGAPDRGT